MSAENASRIYHLETAVRNKRRFSKAIGRFYDGYTVPVNNGPSFEHHTLPPSKIDICRIERRRKNIIPFSNFSTPKMLSEPLKFRHSQESLSIPPANPDRDISSADLKNVSGKRFKNLSPRNCSPQ
ncbi:hypothetical protein CDAR_593501 [Caerostris darwini]|uniref:Uncharacterized protein n=1 Tax=Caerostris darwini TaxID=1538125 RepID=A0AAV4S0B4_9ARAC|nr:hypothetical protein CDAR_593501 [Caerostris darwini]